VTCARGRGQSLVEFALIAPVLLVLALLVLDVGRLFSVWVEITNAAREGAYVASIAYSGDTSAQTITNSVIAENSALGIQSGQVSISYSAAGDSVQVQVNYPFQPLAPFVRTVMGNSLVVSASADFPVRFGGRHFSRGKSR
jgi:Flp pilus assembly protein TadG